MKEMRAKVVAECTLKESAAINQILGRRVSNNDHLLHCFNLKQIINYRVKLPRNEIRVGNSIVHNDYVE